MRIERARELAAAAALIALAGAAAAQDAPLWLRYPAISPDGASVVFTYRGDLYRVAAAGGSATPLTTHAAHDFMPVWSPDGRQIAFASNRRGNFDVYVMPASGGDARRLTFHSAPEYPYAFTPDAAAVLFGAVRQDPAQSRLYPAGSMPELYRVPVAGGRAQQVLATPAEDVQPSRDGQRLLYHDKKGGENAWRKHHTSAIARDLWLYDAATGRHRQLTRFAGEDRNPVFSADEQSVYYLSEESGSFNVHRISIGFQTPVDGGASQQVTNFKGGPVRFLTRAADGTLCFGYEGEIYTLKPGGAPRKLEVAIAVDARAGDEKVVAITSGARELAVAPSGKEVAFVARGDVFVTSVEGGVTRRITNTPGQERAVSFSPDGQALLYAAERGGHWSVFETRRRRQADPHFYVATVLVEKALVANEHDNTQPAWSHDGKRIAYVEDRAALRVLDVASGQARTLLTSRELTPGAEQHFQWSPDGRFLLFDYAVPGFAPGEVGLVAADGQTPAVNLTHSGFHDGDGQWVLGGTAMIWRGNRDGLKAVAQTGRTQQDAYGLFFTRAAWDRFRLTKEEYALVKEAEEKKEKEKKEAEEKAAKDDKGRKAEKKEEKVEPVSFDMEGLAERKARLTLHSSSLGDVLLSKDGETLYYLAQFESGFNLWSTSLRGKETKQLVALDAKSAQLAWDKEQKTLFVLADGALAKIDPATAKKEAIAIKGEMAVDVAAERREQFEHAWRQTAKTFYTAGFHGADWNALKATYARYVPHVGNDFELAELLSELLGELNVSHSGARHSASDPGDDATASLGLLFDPAHRGAGLKIDEVLIGGPLDKATITVKPGMILESIDGEPLAADRDLARLLNRKAGKPTLVGLADGSAGPKAEAVVRPITEREEERLLYRRWVLRNQAEVERLSGGALGYVHVPGMNDAVYRSVFEDVMGRYADRKGLVVDTRFNSGGDLVADLAMFLSGRKFFDYTTDTRSLGFEPNFRWTKPSISLVNEANYSDGHCYAYTVKALGIGKLVGMPVPGTCTFAGWELLGDTGIRWGAPPVGVKGTDGRYLENAQTAPDIALPNSPELVVQGRDEQLEAAVAALMKEVAGGSPR